MTNYVFLAVRYLKQNKRRSIITVIGTTITVMVLFSCLNFSYCFLLQIRADRREEQDYEIVLFTQTTEEIEAILQDSQVERAYVGPYYDYSYRRGETLYPNALYINTVNPYRMNAIFERLKSTYQVEGDYHDELAVTYLQGQDGNLMTVVILFVILVTYIFTIFGVGIIRNSLNLSILENVRDYGNLRCIGSSRKQIRFIVYVQGLILEMLGIVSGSILGTGICVGIAAVLRQNEIVEIQIGFHLLPVLLIITAFVFDLYFIMDENVKLVIKMSPVSAIRGEYRIKTGKIKRREKNIFRKLLYRIFGVDGDYAFKSVVRNSGRFWRTVSALVFGISAFMGIAAMVHNYIFLLRKNIEEYKYYQIYVENKLEPGETIEQIESSLPSAELLSELSAMEDITEAKRMYAAVGYLSSYDELWQHFSEDYLATTGGIDRMETAKKAEEESDSLIYRHFLSAMEEVTCYGYDEADLSRYEPVLVDGTLDVSSRGVILVNKTVSYNINETSYREDDTYETIEVKYTDYQVGDTIKITDIGELHRRLDPLLQAIEEDYYKAMKELETDNTYNEQPKSARAHELAAEYNEDRQRLIQECKRQLAEDGYYRTYIIEGIVEEDVNLHLESNFRLIMPLENYFDLTGTDASSPTGMMYHTNHSVFLDAEQISYILNMADMNQYETGTILEIDNTTYSFNKSFSNTSGFVYDIIEIQSQRNTILASTLVVLFIVLMTCLNTINATASNLYLRRKELAQLRVIGVSKKRLMKIVMLEGIITALTANLIGIAIGGGASYEVFRVLHALYGVKYYFPFGMVIFGIVVSILVLCGAVYVPIKELNNDIVDSLKAGGD